MSIMYADCIELTFIIEVRHDYVRCSSDVA